MDIWIGYKPELVGREKTSIIRLMKDSKLVLCRQSDCVIVLRDNNLEMGSSQCKLKYAILTYTGYDKTGKRHEGNREKFPIEEVWFRNRDCLIETAREKGYEASAWCRLEQERTYLIYKKRNQDIAYYNDMKQIQEYSSDNDMIDDIDDSDDLNDMYGEQTLDPENMVTTLDDNSVLSHLTENEDHD